MNLICPRLLGSTETSNSISITPTAIFNNLFTLSANSVVKYLPSVEDILEHILAHSENTLKDISLVIDNGLLQRAGVIIDNRQIRKVLTFPGNKVFYEFTRKERGEEVHYCLRHHCTCNEFKMNLTKNNSIQMCEHLLAIALCENMNISIPERKVHLVDVVNSF